MRSVLAIFAGIASAAQLCVAAETPILRVPEGLNVGEPRGAGRAPMSVPSSWQTREKEFHARLFSGVRTKVLVMPFQVESELAFGKSAQSLITAMFTKALADATGLDLPDPYMLDRMVGAHDRRINPNQMYRLAEQLSADILVACYVGHDGKGTMHLTAMVWQRKGQKFPTRDFPPYIRFATMPFSEARPSFEVYRERLPEILKAFGVQAPSGASPQKAGSIRGPQKLPSKLSALAKAATGPAARARYFHLLAALTPGNAARVRGRFAEKAYLALLDLSPFSPEYKALRTRTLLYLGERPAALAALDKPETFEERMLLEVLNGNLPQARSLLPKLPSGTAQLTAWLEVNAIALAYGARSKRDATDAVKELRLPGDIWPWLVYRAATDAENWAQFDNAIVKRILDLEYPAPGYGLEDILHGAIALGQAGDAQTRVDLAVIEHKRRLLSSDHRRWCCAPTWGRPSEIDGLDLFEAIGTDNLMRRAKFLSETQALPREALDFARQIESVYADHPSLAYAIALAEKDLAETADTTAREGLLQSAAAHARNAMRWEGGQTPVSAGAFGFNPGIPDPKKDGWANYYSSDLPYRPFYPAWDADPGGTVVERNLLSRIRQSTYEFGAVMDLVRYYGAGRRYPARVVEVLQSIEGRFAGHPDRLLLLANHYRSIGERAKATRHFESGIQEQPNSWSLHEQFGRFLFENGDPMRAADVMLAFAGFRPDSTLNAVDVANQAFDAGSLFYWAGHLDQAAPLFRISAATHSGSNASITSELRLKLMERDIYAANDIMQQRARRYPSGYNYRDYLGMLHGLGRSEEAWAAFNVLAPQLTTPHIWESALAGHRVAGANEEQVYEWSKRNPLREAGTTISYASLHLVRAGVTDRVPSAQLARRVTELARPAWSIPARGFTVRPAGDGSREYVVGPRTSEGSIMMPGDFAALEKTRTKSELVHFVEAYRAIHTGSFRAARDAFPEVVRHYDLSIRSLGYLLPYYAYAAARSNDAGDILLYLNGFSQERKGFDYFLAKAIGESFAGNHDAADGHLQTALHRMPYTDGRAVQVEYQYGEICEWLFEATKEPRYRQRALEWAQRNQVIQPWHAWPYAMEAVLTEDTEARQRAIAMTHYLDKNSERLARIPRLEIDAAVQAFKGRNPFVAPPPQNPPRST